MMEDQQIVIEVTHPEKHSEIGGVNKFTVYTLKGSDKKGNSIHSLIDINRRYSDFTLLRQTMVKRWPGCYIPSLPQKKTIGNNEALFIESRRRGLEQFLKTISKSPVLWESEQVQIFLRNNTDSQRVLSPLLKEGFDKLIARYQSIFPNIQETNIGKNSEGKILQFSSYLKDSKTVLEKLTQMVDKMNETSKKNLQKKLIVLQFLLPDYQKNCILENDEKGKAESLLFLNSKTNGITEAVQKLKTQNEYPPILIILEEIKRQKRQIEAFQELMKIRDDYDNHMQKAKGKVKDLQIEMSKINSGKQSLILKIKMKNKEELLALNAADLQKANQELDNYTYICKIINHLMSTKEIDKFKHIRQKAYFNLLKKFATEEKALSEAEKDIWVSVGRHDWINLEEQNNLLGIIRKDVNEFAGNLEVIGEQETQIQSGEHKDQSGNNKDQQIL